MSDQPARPNRPQEVQPAPIPTTFEVATVTSEAGESMVLLRVTTPVGSGFYFLDAETAVQVGNALRAQGKAGIRPKLVVPANGLVVPGGQVP